MSVRSSLGNVVVALLLAALPVAALAKGDPARGQEKAAKVCEACHGADGMAADFPQYPRLAGQYASYLSQALHDYKSGDRSDPVMGGIVSTLSEQDIEDLSAWFSTLKGLKDLSGK